MRIVRLSCKHGGRSKRTGQEIWANVSVSGSGIFLGRLPKVDLIILEGGKMSVRTSVHKKFLRFQ